MNELLKETIEVLNEAGLDYRLESYDMDTFESIRVIVDISKFNPNIKDYMCVKPEISLAIVEDILSLHDVRIRPEHLIDLLKLNANSHVALVKKEGFED